MKTDAEAGGDNGMYYSASDLVLLHGDPAVATFDMLEKIFIDLHPCISKAREYAKSDSPILIESAASPELEMLAQAIHNGSERRKESYAVITLSGTTNETQENVLFGDPKTGRRGAILDSNHGTLMIQGIDKLTLPMQAQLARVIRTKRVRSHTNYAEYRYVDLRIIGSTSKNLTELRNQFLFRSDLLFTFRALRLRILKLRERPNDVRNMLDFYLQDFNKRYKTQHILTERARERLLLYPWEGNVTQLEAFCERMILTAPEQKLKDDYIESLLHELYEQDSAFYEQRKDKPDETRTQPIQPELTTAVPQSNDVYRDVVAACLKRNNGNRRKTAQELGISTTTLWRKIQYYHLNE